MAVRMDFRGIFIVFAGPNYNIKTAVTKTHSDGTVHSQSLPETQLSFDSGKKKLHMASVLTAYPLVDKTIIAYYWQLKDRKSFRKSNLLLKRGAIKSCHLKVCNSSKPFFCAHHWIQLSGYLTWHKPVLTVCSRGNREFRKVANFGPNSKLSNNLLPLCCRNVRTVQQLVTGFL